MATETWTLYFDRTMVGSTSAVFPSTLTMTVDTDKNFTQIIRVKEGGTEYDRTFDCKWQGTTKDDLVLERDDTNNKHYYRGRIHKKTISRGGPNNPVVYPIVVGILGHKPDPYPSSGVGNEDNVVIFTGTT